MSQESRAHRLSQSLSVRAEARARRGMRISFGPRIRERAGPRSGWERRLAAEREHANRTGSATRQGGLRAVVSPVSSESGLAWQLLACRLSSTLLRLIDGA